MGGNIIGKFGGSGSGGNGGSGYPSEDSIPMRETEIGKEMLNLRSTAAETRETAMKLVERLASVITPMSPSPNKETTKLEPRTPLATNLREITKDLEETLKTLNFILEGLEL